MKRYKGKHWLDSDPEIKPFRNVIQPVSGTYNVLISLKGMKAI